jgi:alanine racemase
VGIVETEYGPTLIEKDFFVILLTLENIKKSLKFKKKKIYILKKIIKINEKMSKIGKKETDSYAAINKLLNIYPN